MPRKIFGLSDQTKETLTDNVKPIAAAWDCTTGFLYQILREEKADVYPPFREFYVAHCRAGISTRAFDEDMADIRDREMRPANLRDATACFTNKTRTHNRTLERYMESLEDGQIDEREAAELDKLLQKEQDSINLIRRALKFKRENNLRIA